MKAKSLSAQLKKASSISAQTVADRLIAHRNRIENGHFSPSLDTLTRLSVVLKCRLSDLVEAKRSKR
jgi:transcriptional regulator with XRE-family HTH domain